MNQEADAFPALSVTKLDEIPLMLKEPVPVQPVTSTKMLLGEASETAVVQPTIMPANVTDAPVPVRLTFSL